MPSKKTKAKPKPAKSKPGKGSNKELLDDNALERVAGGRDAVGGVIRGANARGVGQGLDRGVGQGLVRGFVRG